MNMRNIKERIKEHFFIYPTAKLRVRQIEREVKVPLPSVIRYTKELVREDILQIVDVSGVRFYTSNRSSSIYLLEKKIFNLKIIYNSGLLEELISKSNNATIVLFGSYSRGEDTEKSDIDVYIEDMSVNEKEFYKFEKKINRKIQLFKYKNIKAVENKELANNIINGIVLNGRIEVF